ncbi:MAG: hypothetical protein ACO4AU_14605 [bacterium]|jgi:hypothetical protein
MKLIQKLNSTIQQHGNDSEEYHQAYLDVWVCLSTSVYVQTLPGSKVYQTSLYSRRLPCLA